MDLSVEVPHFTPKIFNGKLTSWKYFSENWYIGSMVLNVETAKYKTAPLVAIGRYFSLAIEMLFSVVSESSRRATTTADVSYKILYHYMVLCSFTLNEKIIYGQYVYIIFELCGGY